MRPLRVLVIDDSAVIREVLSHLLASDPMITVVGTARDGATGLAAIEKLAPDVVTLDLEMPGLSGLEVLKRLRGRGIPTIVVASQREAGSDLAVTALTVGAFDFVAKPAGIDAIKSVARELIEKVKAAGSRRRVSETRVSARPPAAPMMAARTQGVRRQLIAIGASTGGPEALVTVLSALPPDTPPVLIVQHMPEAFTAKFAKRLDGRLRVRVEEATDGAPLRQGVVLLAPGSHRHMVLARSGTSLVVRLIDGAPVKHHRPSVDVMFESCAQLVGRAALGAILTGMGSDGARGLLTMRNAGATTIAQDEATSVVYGMPMEAVALGAATYVLPLPEIGRTLAQLAVGQRPAVAV